MSSQIVEEICTWKIFKSLSCFDDLRCAGCRINKNIAGCTGKIGEILVETIVFKRCNPDNGTTLIYK